MKVPCRVLKGSGGGQGAYLLDAGFDPMTQLTGGIGAVLVDNNGIDLPTVTWDPATWNAMQAYFLGRKAALDALAACETCPTESMESAVAVLTERYELDPGYQPTAVEHAKAILGQLQGDRDGKASA